MSTITFLQSITCHWLYLADDTKANTFFLLPPDFQVPPAQISLTDSWENYSEGCYIFLHESLTVDHEIFAKAVWGFLSDPSRRERPLPAPFFPAVDPNYYPRFAWFSNPDEAAIGLRGQSISLYHTDTPAAWRTDRLNSFQFDDKALRIIKHCIVDLKKDQSGFDFSALPAVNEYRRLDTPPDQKYAITVSLVMGGENSGAFLVQGKSSGPDLVRDFSPEIRYFFPDSDSSRNHTKIISQRYPILSSDRNDWQDSEVEYVYHTYLYPNQLKEGHQIIASPVSLKSSLPSCFRTNLGYAIHLIPLGEFELKIARLPDSTNDGQKQTYTTLRGTFEISIPDQPSRADANLICGLSGVEYIRLPGDKKHTITFISGKSAYAPAFRLDQSQVEGTGSSKERLTAQATTAWIYITQENQDPADAENPLYYAQPDQAVLYTNGGAVGDFLEYMEVPVVSLPSSLQESSAFPVAPYGNVESTLIENYQKFEAGLLAPARRDAIRKITTGQTGSLVSTSRSDPLIGTTPQGLLAEYSANYETMNRLVVATYQNAQNVQEFLEFHNILRTDSLRSALQSNQLFLVISNPASIREHFTKNQLSIKDWIFDLNPDHWDEHNTLLVFKFHNHSLQDLAAASHAWTMAGEFSKDPIQDSQVLSEIFQLALEKAPAQGIEENKQVDPQGAENYRQLSDAITNPRWNGILAFNVTVPPGGLPAELIGLTSGIDSSRFCAQYLGISSSTVRATSDGKLEIQQSSLFGLIDYVDDGGVTALDSGYNFTVSKLNVLFQNAEVKHFAGEVVLVLDKLFGEVTALQNSVAGRNEILLVGRSESHDGRNTYSFSSSDFSRFDLPQSPIIDEVEIVKTQFSTDPPKAGSSYLTGELVKSRFLFWGRVDFTKWSDQADPQTDFDLLSFGSEPTESGGGASFSNLQVLSFFAWPETGKEDQTRTDGNRGKTFVFKADEVVFNLTKSKFRQNSLFAKFPLKLIGMVEGGGSSGKKSPDSLGFMQVRTPMGGDKPKEGSLWYGLVYDLDLGSAGALAGKAGIFVSLIAAWQPGVEAKVYTGLRLPGSSGGRKELSIQGILKIVFKSIELTGPKDNTGYLLKLRHIALKFMILELPPNAQSEIIIFGDPEGEGGKDSLAWYAAYAKQTT